MMWPHFECKWNPRSEDRVKVQGFNGEWYELEKLTTCERMDWARLYFETWIAIQSSKGKRLNIPIENEATILPPEIRGMLRQARLITFTQLDPGTNESSMPSLFASLNGDAVAKRDVTLEVEGGIS